MPIGAVSPCVVIQGGDERARGEVTIKDLILGATLTETKDRDEYLKKQAEAQFSVPESSLSTPFAALSPVTKLDAMAAESAKEFEALEAQATTLLDSFRRGGLRTGCALPFIQPADIFLDQIGEEIRSRTYVFTDLAGDELCLRPDLTVPVSRLYLERHPDAKAEARYCYNGPGLSLPAAGRAIRPTHASSARPASNASVRADRDSADVEIVLLAADAVRAAGLKDFRLRFGDIALFYALLDALELPERWRLKLRHYFWRPPVFHKLLARLAKGDRTDCNGPVAAFTSKLAGKSLEKAEELVAAYLEREGFPLAGNRTLGRDHRAAASITLQIRAPRHCRKKWRRSSTATSP